MSEILTANQIWPRVRAQSKEAQERGALVPLETSVSTVEDEGVPFTVRVAQNLKRKQQASSNPGSLPAADPFAPPYEQDLYVGPVSQTHVALLNKFCVISNHTLLVTREYAGQTELLDASDFHALARALASVDGLVFYNGGEQAGASQPHKHLQLVPLPLAPDQLQVPLVPWLTECKAGPDGVTHNPALPFPHAVTDMPGDCLRTPDKAARQLQERYLALWSALNYRLQGNHQPVPYNLLATRDWLWLVPRSHETHEGLAVNGLGYAGALMVRDEAQFETLRETGPMRVLAAVAGPRGDA